MMKLPTKSAELQAYYLRKREIDHQRAQRTQAVSQYYDHWGKVTSRYENWTAPEYYQKAEEQVKSAKNMKEKKKDLAGRQAKLRSLFDKEMSVYDIELKNVEKRRGNRSAQHATDILLKTQERLKEQENIRRKLEMEAKLYGKFRYGVDDEELLFKSKTDNQVLAKLNWLDKQVHDQMEREKQEAEAQDKALKFQEETRRIEEIQKQRQHLREKEIRELRSLQETQMERINEHKRESELLRKREEELKHLIEEVEKERELLDESTAASAMPTDLDFAYNIKKVKVVMRQRSENYRKQLKVFIGVLERLLQYANRKEEIEHLIGRYQTDLEKETLIVPQIEAMYESEAKQNLLRNEEIWQKQTLSRYRDVKNLLDKEHQNLSKQLDQNLATQNEIVEIRAHLLASIDGTNEKLKHLVNEDEEAAQRDALPYKENVENISPAQTEMKPFSARLGLEDKAEDPQGSVVDFMHRFSPSARSLHRVKDLGGDKLGLSNSFSNLNLVPSSSSSTRVLPPKVASSNSMAFVTPENVEKPKFGRKKVAWT